MRIIEDSIVDWASYVHHPECQSKIVKLPQKICLKHQRIQNEDGRWEKIIEFRTFMRLFIADAVNVRESQCPACKEKANVINMR